MDILLTGATGFLGKTIFEELQPDKIITVGRNNSDILADITDDIPNLPQVNLVIHCAGKAHMVPKTTAETQLFYDVNVTGTNNLLLSLEKAAAMPQYFVFISTVAVYGAETGTEIDEHAPLAAKDPYGLSKIQAEQLVSAWCNRHNIKCTILRLPLLAGANPPGNLKSMINGIKKGYYFNIAGGKAKKSMVLAKDVARIIPAAALMGGTYNLTDGIHPTFSQLSQLMARQLNKKTPHNIPYSIARLMALAGDLIGTKSPINSDKLRKITSDLTFNDTKARKSLHWNPQPVLSGFVL